MERLLNQRYLVISKLGQGGMGAVYKACDIQLGNRLVAIKEMSQHGLNPQQISIASKAFEQEAHMLAGLHHPNLPSIHEYFTETGHWYLVMEFIEGETLESYLKVNGGRLPVKEVLNIGIQLCTVLDYLHMRQPPIIFRDLKPLNIMRAHDGQLYLIDFGIARHFKPGQARDTAIAYSQGYAAPEQYGEAQTTTRADVYSLGATLHYLLSGIHPARTPFRFAPLGLPKQSNATVLEVLIMQMVNLDASKRPANMAVIKQRLESIAARQTTGQINFSQSLGRTPPPTAEPAYKVFAPPPNYMQSQQQQPPKKQRRWLWIVLGIVVVPLLVCGGGGLLVFYLGTHNGATDVANQYYTAVKNQDYNTAFTYLDTSNLTLNGQPLTQSLYIQGAGLIDQTKGKLTAYSITNTSLNSNNGVNTAMLTVSETRNGAPYDVHVQLKQESNGWKITSLDNF